MRLGVQDATMSLFKHFLSEHGALSYGTKFNTALLVNYILGISMLTKTTGMIAERTIFKKESLGGYSRSHGLVMP